MSTNSNANEAVFVFASVIDQQSVASFVINLVNWSGNNPGRPLRIDINSQGGNILDGLALYEEFMRLRRMGHRLTIAVYGRAASTAGWLLQAGDVRIIGSKSWILIHEVRSSLSGSLTEMRREVKRCRDLQRQTFGIIASRSKLTVSEMRRKSVELGDWWINAKAAKEFGIVDLIEEDPPFAPLAQGGVN